MTDTYTKLFSSITTSTIWLEPDHILRLWVYMLANADQEGCVYGAIPGLAHAARVSLQDTEEALNRFMSPDKFSRTKDFGGRRIEEIAGGWRLLNHQSKHRVWTDEQRREYKRKWTAEKRAAEKLEAERLADEQEGLPLGCGSDVDKMSTPVDSCGSSSIPVDALDNCTKPNERTKDQKQSQEMAVSDGNDRSPFERFWKAYPIKKKKKAAMQAWKKLRLDNMADRLVEDIETRLAEDRVWMDGLYIPHPTTYLNGSLWEDEIDRTRTAGNNRSANLKRGLDDLKALNDEARTLARGGSDLPALAPPVHDGPRIRTRSR